MTTQIKIPKRFFDDHGERELPTPEPSHETKRYYWIDPTDPAMSELINDAKFYADPYGPDGCPEIVRAAKALLKAIAHEKKRS